MRNKKISSAIRSRRAGPAAVPRRLSIAAPLLAVLAHRAILFFSFCVVSVELLIAAGN